MRGLGGLIRLERWQLDEKRRALADLERLREDLSGQSERLQDDLERELDAAADTVEGRDGLDRYLSVMRERRERLMSSIEEVEASIEVSRATVGEAFERVKSIEQAEERRQRRLTRERERRDAARETEVGLAMHRAKSSA